MKRTMIITVAVLFAACASLIVVSATGGRGDASAAGSESKEGSGPVITPTIVLSGLNSPWDLAFTPDGAMLFTEKCRGLSVLRPDGSVRRLFGSSGSDVIAGDFFCQGQSGMLGVAVDPEFTHNRFVYLYMSSNLGGSRTNRVVRLIVDPGYTTVSGRRDIVPDISYKIAANVWGGRGGTVVDASASVPLMVFYT